MRISPGDSISSDTWYIERVSRNRYRVVMVDWDNNYHVDKDSKDRERHYSRMAAEVRAKILNK